VLINSSTCLLLGGNRRIDVKTVIVMLERLIIILYNSVLIRK